MSFRLNLEELADKRMLYRQVFKSGETAGIVWFMCMVMPLLVRTQTLLNAALLFHAFGRVVCNQM